jgi:alkylation response protein AidB-like acyl-CoA dehydrogenase
MTVTLQWLHQYADDRRTEPVVHTKYIRQAIVDFEMQIEAMKARLRELTSDRATEAL